MIFTQIVVVGAGPAGLSAAIQLKRSGLEVLVVEKALPGGLISNGWNVENFPGMPPLKGEDVAGRLVEAFDEMRIPFVKDEIIDLSKHEGEWILKSISEEYVSSNVIIAAGTVPIIPNIHGLKNLPDTHIHYNVSEMLLTAQRICIIGGGDAAYDQALTLEERGNEVHIVQRSISTALPLLQNEVVRCENIDIHIGIEISGISFCDHGKICLQVKGDDNFTMDFDHILLACGRKPSPLYRPDIKQSGIYFCGDIVNGLFRQAGIAAGDGLRTAMKLLRDIGHAPSN